MRHHITGRRRSVDVRRGTPTVSAPPTPLPSELVISVDDITLTEGDGTTTTVAFSDGDAVLALLGEQLGSTPEGTRDPPDAMYPFEQTYYDWGGVYLTVPDGEARSSLAFGVPEFNGVELRTIGGIGVEQPAPRPSRTARSSRPITTGTVTDSPTTCRSASSRPPAPTRSPIPAPRGRTSWSSRWTAT